MLPGSACRRFYHGLRYAPAVAVDQPAFDVTGRRAAGLHLVVTEASQAAQMQIEWPVGRVRLGNSGHGEYRIPRVELSHHEGEPQVLVRSDPPLEGYRGMSGHAGRVRDLGGREPYPYCPTDRV